MVEFDLVVVSYLEECRWRQQDGVGILGRLGFRRSNLVCFQGRRFHRVRHEAPEYVLWRSVVQSGDGKLGLFLFVGRLTKQCSSRTLFGGFGSGDILVNVLLKSIHDTIVVGSSETTNMCSNKHIVHACYYCGSNSKHDCNKYNNSYHILLTC